MALKLERLVHEPLRLGILTALSRGPRTFAELKEGLAASDGNLGVHARKLEEAGYVACRKAFEGRVPRSRYRITPAGRAALRRYRRDLRELLGGL